MNKFQKVNFQSLTEFFDYLPDEELIIAEALRAVILEAIPAVREKLSFNVPYYALHSNICFIWPASMPWGAVEKGVSLGFVRGHLLLSGEGYLESKDRKTIRSKTFQSLQEIDFELVRTLIYEAVEIDIEYNRNKSK